MRRHFYTPRQRQTTLHARLSIKLVGLGLECVLLRRDSDLWEARHLFRTCTPGDAYQLSVYYARWGRRCVASRRFCNVNRAEQLSGSRHANALAYAHTLTHTYTHTRTPTCVGTNKSYSKGPVEGGGRRSRLHVRANVMHIKLRLKMFIGH